MSEAKGPFDEAMRTLRVYNASLTVSEAERSSREAAIRVLEAAGKVEDLEMLIQVIKDLSWFLKKEGRIAFIPYLTQVIILLEALPDGECK